MTPMEALLDLLERVGASNGAALLSEEELSRWPESALQKLKSQKLLLKATPATTVVCPGCEQACTMPVHSVSAGTGKAGSFVVCDKRDDINRVPVSAEGLKQWQCRAEAIREFVVQNLKMRSVGQRQIGAGLWELGLAQGKKRSQMLCLRASGVLELVVGNNTVPLAAVMRSEKDGYSVDDAAIRQLVDMATTGDCRYTPSNARREARKLKTQSVYERWQKEYRALKKSRPEMSDVWHAQQIARKPIAKGRSADTIRKHMAK